MFFRFFWIYFVGFFLINFAKLLAALLILLSNQYLNTLYWVYHKYSVTDLTLIRDHQQMAFAKLHRFCLLLRLKPTKATRFNWTVTWKFFQGRKEYVIDGALFVTFGIQRAILGFYELFENILHEFLSEIISGTSLTPIKTSLTFWVEKHYIFSKGASAKTCHS